MMGILSVMIPILWSLTIEEINKLAIDAVITFVVYNSDNKIIMLSLPDINTKNSNHQLNNEGCLCPFCQKINITSNMVQSIFFYFDRNSE